MILDIDKKNTTISTQSKTGDSPHYFRRELIYEIVLRLRHT